MNLVDMEPITLADFVLDDEHFVIDPPLRCEVEYDKDSRCYGLRGDLELVLFAYSRSELAEVLEETLQDWWLVYVAADEVDLSRTGKEKRREIMARIKRETKCKRIS